MTKAKSAGAKPPQAPKAAAAPSAPAATPQAARPNVVLHGRYIKDFSFENPAAPVVVDRQDLRIDIAVEVGGRRLDSLHEVVVSLTATATHEAKIIFLAELSYAGLFELDGLDGEPRRRFIYCEAPRILFPWIDRIIADAARDGGLPPLNLTPPDFTGLYQHEQHERASAEKAVAETG